MYLWADLVYSSNTFFSVGPTELIGVSLCGCKCSPPKLG